VISSVEPPGLPRDAALFLDFDGTLAPIAPRPQDVVVPSWVVPTLTLLERLLGGAVAVVSGRPLGQIDNFLKPLRLPAAGVHGVERRLTSGQVRVHAGQPPHGVHDAAAELTRQYPQLLLEVKPGALALHYRAAPELADLCSTTLHRALQGDADWDIIPGHCVFEVKARRVSKARVLQAFLAESRFAGRLPVYAGDDTTDEDGILEAQAGDGWGVKVGEGPSAARYRLADPAAVGAWLTASARALGGTEA
jgi:trehalose 6-phosphate phosphatase